MEYIEFNPIPEVESSDEEAHDLQMKLAPINLAVEDSSENQETPLSALLRQESKSKFDFSLQDSYKPKQQVLDTFPNIRGLEFESQKSPGGESPKVFTRRASSILKTSSDPFKFDSDKELLGDELKSQSSEADKAFSRTTSKRSKTFNALDNIDLLRGVLNGKISSPETMLLTAIGTFYDVDLASRKKEPKLLDLALTVLDQILLKHQRIICYQDDLNEDFKKLQIFSAETLDESYRIEDEMNICKSLFQENRSNFEAKLKLTHHKIYLAKNSLEKYSYTLKESVEDLERIRGECAEAEERWKMNIEDLNTQLYWVHQEKIQKQAESESLLNLFNKISKQKTKNKTLKKKVEISTQSFVEVLNYLNESKLKKDFAQEFTELLQDLESEISAAALAEQEFKENALTDPKSKVSNHLFPESLTS
jgi:hypothetical protein